MPAIAQIDEVQDAPVERVAHRMRALVDDRDDAHRRGHGELGQASIGQSESWEGR